MPPSALLEVIVERETRFPRTGCSRRPLGLGGRAHLDAVDVDVDDRLGGGTLLRFPRLDAGRDRTCRGRGPALVRNETRLVLPLACAPRRAAALDESGYLDGRRTDRIGVRRRQRLRLRDRRRGRRLVRPVGRAGLRLGDRTRRRRRRRRPGDHAARLRHGLGRLAVRDPSRGDALARGRRRLRCRPGSLAPRDRRRHGGLHGRRRTRSRKTLRRPRRGGRHNVELLDRRRRGGRRCAWIERRRGPRPNDVPHTERPPGQLAQEVAHPATSSR